ncbi:MAG: hypothetical protein ABIZ07_02345, partial [Dermatophilaceae bacterium]
AASGPGAPGKPGVVVPVVGEPAVAGGVLPVLPAGAPGGVFAASPVHAALTVRTSAADNAAVSADSATDVRVAPARALLALLGRLGNCTGPP